MTQTTVVRSVMLGQTEKNRRLGIVAAAYATAANRGKLFQRIPRIEDMSDDLRRTHSTIGTLLQPAVNALNQAGITTESNLGSLERNLGLEGDEIHDLACAYHGMQIDGAWMSDAFLAYQNGD